MNCFIVNKQLSLNADAFSTTQKDKKKFYRFITDQGVHSKHDEIWKRFKAFKKANK